MPKFKDPKTGQIVNVNYFLVFLSSLLFGLFFFLYIGETQHALVMVGFGILITLVGIFVSPIAILYAYVFPLIYSFIAPKIVKDKWLRQGYISVNDSNDTNINFEKRKIKPNINFEKGIIKAKQGFKESIQGKTIVINFLSNFIPLLIGYAILITLIILSFSINGWFFYTLSDILITFVFSIVIAIIITILNILDASIMRLLPLPVNRFTKHLLTYSFVLLIVNLFIPYILSDVAVPANGFTKYLFTYPFRLLIPLVFLFIPFVLLNLFVKKCMKNYYNNSMKLSSDKVIFIVKQTFLELVNEVFNKVQKKQISKD